MGKNISTILAVNPGSRYVGCAVFKDEELLDWRVSSLRRGGLNHKKDCLRKLLSEFDERYGITAMVLKRVDPFRSSPALNELVAVIRLYAKGKSVNISELPLQAVKNKLLARKKSNKRDIMELVSSRYTFLKPLHHRQSSSKHPYLVRMFEAVALGMAVLTAK